MAKNNETLNSGLFQLLRSRGYQPTMLGTDGKEMPVPEEAEVFQFNFIKDEEDYGPVTLSIDGLHKLIVYFGDNVANSPSEETHSEDTSWYTLLNHLKRYAQKHQLSFEVQNTDHLKYDMAKRTHMKKVDEGYYPTGKKSSYSDNIPEVKIILQHSRALEEGERRYRAVEKIFVENATGERFAIPTNKPGLARVYARHIAEGGTPYDDHGKHITSLCEEYSKMAGFVRATRSKQFNESTQSLVNEGINHYQKLRETLGKMQNHRGYTAYFESFTPALMEDEDTTDLSEMFASSELDPRIESVMPILRKLNKSIAEMVETTDLGKWADDVIGESSVVDETAYGDAQHGEQQWQASPKAAVSLPGNRPWTLMLNGKVIGTDKNVANLRALQQKRGGKIVRQGEVAEEAKWRKGYSASGHPAGHKHKSGEVGPIGGTYTNEPSGYDGETSKVPVQKHRDQPDQLADRGQTKISAKGTPLTAKNAQRNLKGAIVQSKGKHGPVGALPESEGGTDERTQKIARLSKAAKAIDRVERMKKALEADRKTKPEGLKANLEKMLGAQPGKKKEVAENIGFNSNENWAIKQLSKLPQPITVNGGAYGYRVDVTKKPLQWTASDGSPIERARTLHDIGAWMDDTTDWYLFLDGRLDLEDLVADRIVRPAKQRNTLWSDQEEHELNMREEDEMGAAAPIASSGGSGNPQGIPEATGPTPTQVFPDTKQGAVASFNKNANKRFVQEMDLPNCKVFPDPQVEGVWAIDNYKTGVRVIVYLAGYKEPMGGIRGPYDDFEEGEIPEREMKRHRRNDQAMNDIEDEMMDEGRFIKGPGGVPLDRQGNPIPPKEPKVSAPRAPAVPKLTLDAVWRKVEEVVGNIYPDGDPIDWMLPWFKRQGIEDFKVGEIIDRAARKNGYKDMYDYWKSFADDVGYTEGVAEGLDANQKAAGQAGPTDKAPLKGKLVGACESVAEGQEGLDTIRRLLGK